MDGFRAIHVGMHRDWLDPLFWVLTSTGLGWVQAILILSLLIWKPTRRFTGPLLVTLIVSGVFVSDVIKLFVHRERPSNLIFAHPQETEFGANSFPSGHATTAFAIAFMIFLMTRKKEYAWVGQVAIGWATLVALSRVYRGVHWPTDTIAGLFAGLFSACLVYIALGLNKPVEVVAVE